MANQENLPGHRERLRGGSRSFFAASLLLPSPLSSPATVLYSFCRVADDLIDDSDDPNRALAQLQERLDGIYAGAPTPDPIDSDFATLVREFDIPKALVQALLEGFMWDARGRQYETIQDLFEYAARVAGSVGVMMALLMRVREPSALARAADLGVAMQLTNIARDVAEDAARGRVYLPSQWLCEQGVGINELYDRRSSDHRLKRVVQRLLDLIRLQAAPSCRPGERSRWSQGSGCVRHPGSALIDLLRWIRLRSWCNWPRRVQQSGSLPRLGLNRSCPHRGDKPKRRQVSLHSFCDLDSGIVRFVML